MKKQISCILLVVLFLTLFTGCGKSPAEPEPRPEPELTDIKGLWIAPDYDAEGTILAAKIDDEYVGIFEVDKENPSRLFALFMGNVENGGAVAEDGSWISKPAKNNAYLNAEEHTITLKEGQLLFDVSIKENEFDYTEETVFIRGEWDDSKMPWSEWGENASLIKDLEIKDSKWALVDNRLYYYMEIYNPNTDIMVSRPRYLIEAKDASGNVLDTTRPELHHISPGEEVISAGLISLSTDISPATVTFTQDSYFEKYLHTGEFTSIAPLEIKDISYGNYTVSGKVVNTEGGEIREYTVAAIIFDANGNIIDIDTIGGDVAANGESAFSLYLHSPDTGSAKVFVCERSGWLH
ncbi:MAG: FxLYD domain-containing protein [Erysipelotrichaceae bacterium]|nr:FxLYD domain-containing protein [Erysipelotrichaceae bacterium]